MANEWWQPIRDLSDKYFAGPETGRGWSEHMKVLNTKLNLSGSHELSTFPDPSLPPSWFIGDIPSVQPDEWILVLSLNPATDTDVEFYMQRKWDAESFWLYQTTWLHHWWNRSFHGSLSRLAMALGLSDAEAGAQDQRKFAASHLVFAELVPYASQRFALSDEVLTVLQEDEGCQIEAEMVETMLRDGRPRLVLVNGSAAVSNLAGIHGSHLQWSLP